MHCSEYVLGLDSGMIIHSMRNMYMLQHVLHSDDMLVNQMWADLVHVGDYMA